MLARQAVYVYMYTLVWHSLNSCPAHDSCVLGVEERFIYIACEIDCGI